MARALVLARVHTCSPASHPPFAALRQVEWWESAILVVCYFGYIGLMVYNEAIVARVKKLEQSWAARASKKAAAKAHKAANPIPVCKCCGVVRCCRGGRCH